MIVKSDKNIRDGRLYLSKKDRKELGSGKTVAITRRNGQLFIYSKEEWQQIVDDVTKINGVRLGNRFHSYFLLQDIGTLGRVQVPISTGEEKR